MKNRFVRSATHDWLGNPDGSISEKQLVLYRSLDENDVGLIMSAHAYVDHPQGRASINQNGIYHDRFIEGYRQLADIAHGHGARFIVQVAHAGVQTMPQLMEGQLPLNPIDMTEDEILKVIDCFAKAVYRVKQAGCDGVQLHLAHGYLLCRFLSSDANRREDVWGRPVENRVRIVEEIIKKARQLVGTDFPILVKLNSTGGFSGTAAIELAEVIQIAKALENLGVCAIEVSGGTVMDTKNSLSRTGIINPKQEAYFGGAAQEIKKAVKIPIILVGGLRFRMVMDRILDDGVADMVSLSRPFVREPDLVRRILSGQQKVSCISCNLCRDFSGIKCNYKA
ncbi:MAG: NADH:flavin oxidoreductase [Bacillota bacterium]